VLFFLDQNDCSFIWVCYQRVKIAHVEQRRI